MCSIGIGGPAGEGKSSLANVLVARLSERGYLLQESFFPLSHAPDPLAPPTVAMWLLVPPSGILSRLAAVLPPSLWGKAHSSALGQSSASAKEDTGGGQRGKEDTGGGREDTRGGRGADTGGGCASYLILDSSGLGVAPPALHNGANLHLVSPREDNKWLARPSSPGAPPSPSPKNVSPLRSYSGVSMSPEEAEAAVAEEVAAAAALRSLAFLQLASSRLVLNQR